MTASMICSEMKRLFLIISGILTHIICMGSVTLSYVADGYSATSVNTAIFRANSVVSHGNIQYTCFYDPEGYVTLAKRVIGKDNWIIKRSQYRGTVTDAHDIISMAIDGDGYIHVAFDHHGHPLHYCRSIAPDSLVLGDLETMVGFDEQDVTYPEFHTFPDGRLIFAYRSGYSGGGNMVMNSYDIKSRKWERLHTVLIDGEKKRNAYWQIFIDDNSTIHLSWVWRESWLVETNHDICYAKSDDGGKTWKRSNGNVYSLPITIQTAEIAWNIPEKSELINQTSMTANTKGRPMIATYWRDSLSSVPQYRLVEYDGEKWKMSTIGKRQTPFSLSGGGTKMIPISRPRIIADNENIFYIFRDSERGSKVSIAFRNGIDGNWEISDLTDFSVDAWEPTLDNELWRHQKKLHIYVQRTSQGDGERVTDANSEPIYILEYNPDNNYIADIKVKNPLAKQRDGEIVELDNCFGNNFCILDSEGNEIPHQVTYDNKLIFRTDISPLSEVIYHVINKQPSNYESIVAGRLYPERLDDMTWENDLAAYRAYGPALQQSGEKAFGYDVWTKSTNRLVVDNRYCNHMNGKSFHIDHGDGMDVYSVGPTLGAGTAAIICDDKIYYPYCFKDYQILDNGPLRFSVKLYYENETRIISLDAGSHFNRTIVAYSHITDSAIVAPGIVIHNADTSSFFSNKQGICILAGYADPTDKPNSDNGVIYIGTIVPNDAAEVELRQYESPSNDIYGHLLTKVPYLSNSQFLYYWGSGWSKCGINSLDDWEKTMTDYSMSINSPLKTTITRYSNE